MAQGAAAAAGPGWSGAGAGAGADDWALALLALAVVAATALALHWLRSRRAPEAAGPASAEPGAGPSQAGGAGPTPPPGAEVSVGGPGQGSGRGGAGLAGRAQAAAGARDRASPGGPAAPAAPPPETPRGVACGGPLGRQHDHTRGAPPGEGREPPRAGGSRAGGPSAALLLHLAPPGPRRAEAAQGKAGGPRARAPGPRGLTGQDSSPPKPGPRPTSSLGRGPGGRRSGRSACRPPRPDPPRLGTVVSVWDAVDAAGGLWAAPPRPTPQARPLGDGSERGLRKGSSAAAAVLALGSGADGSEGGETGPPAFRESRGPPGPVGGWPWARKEVLVTRSFSQASDCAGPWPEARHWGHGPRPQGRGAAEGGAAVGAGRGAAEEPGGHGAPEERGSGPGQGDPGGSQQPAGGAADPGPGRPPGRERPGSGPCQGPGSQSPPAPPRPAHPEYPQPLGSPPTAPPPSGAFPAAPTLPASSSDSRPPRGPAERRNLGSAPAPTQAPTLAPAGGPRPASQGPHAALCRGDQGAQRSPSWGNLILMVLRSHPLPGQPPSQAPSAHAEGPRGPSSFTPSGARRPGVPPEGAAPGEPAGVHPGAGTGSGAEAAPQPRQGSSGAKGGCAPGPPSGPSGEGVEGRRRDGPLRPAATPGAPPGPSEPTAPSRAAQRDSQPVPGPRTRGPGEAEAAESAEGVQPAASGRGAPGGSPGAARGARLSEREREARRLLAFLQRPGSWGAAEGAGAARARAAEPAAAAAWRRRLDLDSCPDALAFARRHGEPGLARAAYALLSGHLLRALRPPGPFRRLRAAERQRVLSLRAGQGPAVLGVLALPGPGPGPGPAGRPGPAPRAHLHVLDPRENAWRPLAPVPAEAPLRGCGLCTLHNYLFLAGGVRGAACSARVFCYDPLAGAWGQVRPMRQARARPQLVALDGRLYAIGGEGLRSVERYDPRDDAWSARAPLPAGAPALAREAAACRGAIYVAGGHLLRRLLRYSPDRDAWDERPGGAGPRRACGLVALGGRLYRFDLLRGVGAAVARYDTATGAWSRAAPLPLPRPLPLRCAALGDTIYCLNRQVTATLVVGEGAARFRAGALRPFPLGGPGVLCPFVLTLPAAAPPPP